MPNADVSRRTRSIGPLEIPLAGSATATNTVPTAAPDHWLGPATPVVAAATSAPNNAAARPYVSGDLGSTGSLRHEAGLDSEYPHLRVGGVG